MSGGPWRPYSPCIGEEALPRAAAHELEPHLRELVRADERILCIDAFVDWVLAAVRADLAVQRVTQFGLSRARAARPLGVATSGIAKAGARAERR